MCPKYFDPDEHQFKMKFVGSSFYLDNESGIEPLLVLRETYLDVSDQDVFRRSTIDIHGWLYDSLGVPLSGETVTISSAGAFAPGPTSSTCASDGTGVEVRKSVTVWADAWMWEANLEVIDRGRRIPASLVMGPGFAAQEERGSRTYYYSNQVLWSDRSGVHRSAEHCGFLFTIACRSWKSAIKKDATPNEATLRSVRWVGLEDQFFTALAVTNSDDNDVGWSTREIMPPAVGGEEGPAEAAPQPLVAVSVPAEGTRFYFGPKVYSELKEYGVGLEKTVWFSSKAWLAAIVRTMYLGLRWLYANVLANWGVAIILATVTLRLALFPLNQFAMVRMRKTQAEMQKVQPKLKAIRAKYGKKKDATSRQKMNKEIYERFKERYEIVVEDMPKQSGMAKAAMSNRELS